MCLFVCLFVFGCVLVSVSDCLFVLLVVCFSVSSFFRLCVCSVVCLCVLFFSFVSFLVSLLLDDRCSDKCQKLDKCFDKLRQIYLL